VALAHRVETALVFDLDGTLIDSVYQHVLACQEALNDEGRVNARRLSSCAQSRTRESDRNAAKE
jgi:beta-phosphoglucomutase-like phosphatase (HAD superfamily)